MNRNSILRLLYSLQQIIFLGVLLLLPILFSHIGLLFWMEQHFSLFGNYSGPKIVFLWVCLGVGFFVVLLRIFFSGPLIFSWFLWKKESMLFGGILFAVLAVGYCWHASRTWWSSNFFGEAPLFLGYGQVLLLLLWYVYVRFLSTSYGNNEARTMGKRKGFSIALVQVLSVGALFVVLYACVQFIWFDPIASYSATFDDSRVFSTLWNPHSLALYCLLLLPVFQNRIFPVVFRFALLGLMALGIILSGSLTGCILLGAYGLYAVCQLQKNWSKSRHWRAHVVDQYWMVILLGILGISAYILFQWEHKLLSLGLRMEIAAQYIQSLLNHPVQSLFVGVGPNWVTDLLTENRSGGLLKYVPHSIYIQSAESFLLDFPLRFGLIPSGILVYAFLRSSTLVKKIHKEVLSIFLVYSCIYVPAITEWMLFLSLVWSTELLPERSELEVEEDFLEPLD